ncbi:MAG: alanine--glyoxylate aminotransferase family protein, partial [Candidatus Aminicenantes bacterium]|nr:alanine--glyoxylate aminotransferase family protein [Candidatus Aminicenantes bacterium]
MAEKLLLIPGPSPVIPRILDALAKPTVSHVGPDMVHDLKEACENLKRIVFCENGQPFIVAGAGTLAMEMALLNTAGPGDRVLVLSQGYFGDRMAQICQAFGFEHDVLASEWGRAVTPGELDARLKTKSYNVVACTHVDTSTGACAPVEEYSQVLERTGALFIVDGVCATGGVAERMDAWGIDVVLTAAQKCFGAPPGLAILVLSERAMDKRKGLPSVPAYYADVLRWLERTLIGPRHRADVEMLLPLTPVQPTPRARCGTPLVPTRVCHRRGNLAALRRWRSRTSGRAGWSRTAPSPRP